jgi:hypothetical protein
MAIEQRNGRTYYYTSERVAGRVVRCYRGSGPAAAAMAWLDGLYREDRESDARDRARRLARRRKWNAKVRGWLAAVAARVAEALRAAGWHQHKREWRRKRGATMGIPATTEQGRPRWLVLDLRTSAGPLDPATAEKSAKGDRSALPAVDEYLSNPAAAALWGDMGRRLLESWVKKFAGKDLLSERALLGFAADLRDRLAGPNPDALVQLVAERVVVAWVTAHVVENRYLRVLDRLIGLPTHHRAFLAQVEMVNRNLLSACRALAKVRRAGLPEVLALVNVNPPARADG